jgi:seryl-tRNA synthetase
LLDRRFIRENRELVTRAVALKREAVDIDAYYEQDARRREALQEMEQLQAEVNRANKEIAARKKAGEDAAPAIAAMRESAARLKELKARSAALEEAVEALYLQIPNLPHESVPEGGEEDGVLVRSWGEPVDPGYEIRPHWELGADLGIMPLEKAARMSGSGFTLLTGDGARLERALINFMLDVHREQGYVEVNVPYLVNDAAMTGTGQLPKLADDMYRSERDGLWLIPTAEVSVTNIHREETLAEAELPRDYVAFSPCFRREAGAAGKDTRGLLRVHQFHKVEMVKFVLPGDSWDVLEKLTDDAEEVLRRLELPYRVVTLAAGDLSFAAAKCYDLEAWAAGVGKWLEVSSCSNFGDFQARRAGIRWKGPSGRGFVHTLNGSGLALPRVLVAILENCQTATGRVRVPDVLRPYLGGQEYIG